MMEKSTIEGLLAGKLGSSDRMFGRVMAVFFGLLAVVPALLKGGSPKLSLVGIALFFVVASQFLPKVLRPLNIIWTAFGLLLHQITSPLILGILFFGVFTPIGILMRLSGRDPLARKWDKRAKSYWLERSNERKPGEQMRLQF